jgi:RNase E specificity factor CsrD
MTPIEIVHIDFMLNGKPLYSHSRTDSYRPLGRMEIDSGAVIDSERK